MADGMLLVVGVNHRTAPLEVRERLSVSDAKLPEIVRTLAALPGIEGASIVSTCNRVETIVSADSEDAVELIVNWMSEMAGTNRSELEKHLYLLRHADVVKHLFRVASGLDSMILGEPQIAGQVRNSFQVSHEVGALDSIVDIVGTAAALSWLRPSRVISRRVPLGGGTVETA
ncbi:MAG: nickel insertion protein, partial [Thermoanaerobaculia bacterium]